MALTEQHPTSLGSREHGEARRITEHDREAVRGAIELVASGAAVRVALVGLGSPDVAAREMQSAGRAAGVPLRLDRSGEDRGTLIVGPRET